MSLASHAVVQSAITFGCQLTLRSEEHNGFLQVQGANESPTLRMERNNQPLLAFESSIFSLVREGFVGLVTEKEIRYNTIVCLVNNATRTTANVQLTDGTERGLRVAMHNSAKPTALRISPKFKTHSSSEFVHHGDKVAFGLDETDLFLRVAERDDGVLELVAASEPTVFDLKRFDRGAAQQYCLVHNYVQAGRTLSIYHRVHDMFLSHSPVEADKKMRKKAIKRNTQWQVTEHREADRHAHSLQNDEGLIRSKAEMVLRHSNVFFSEALTTGALEIVDPGAAGLWVIEAADPTVGGPLRINEMYRLRHFASSRYLAVREVQSSELDFEVTVIDQDDPDMAQDSLFDIEAPMDDDLGHVSTVQSVVRFRHVRTGKFLSTLDTTGTIITPATVHDKGHNRDRLRLRHIPDVVESELQFAVGHLRHFQGWIDYFEGLQNMPRSLMSIVASKETRAVVVRTVESLLALIDLVCRPPVQQHRHGGNNGNGKGGSGDKGGSSGGGGNQQRGGGGGGGGPTTSSGSAASVAAHAQASLQGDKLGLPDPIRQRRLHELGVEQLLLRVALAPFQSRGADSLSSIPPAGGAISLADVGAKECTPIVTAVRLCFQLLRCIVKGSMQHCLAAHNMVEMMMYLESHQLHVAPAILAVLEYGGQMAHCRQLLLLNDTAPNALYIDAIAHFCASEANVQEVIALLGEHPRTLVRTAVEYGRLMCAHHTIGRQGQNEDALLAAAAAAAAGGHDSAADEHIEAVTFDVFITQEDGAVISYFVATLRLFLAIARHGGVFGLDFARGLVVREEVLIVLATSFKDMRNQNQADIVRATYAELATVLYLARDAQRAVTGGLSPVIVDPTGLLRGTAVRAIGAGTQTNDLGQSLLFGSQSVDGTFLRQLKISALEFIKEHPVQVIELTGRNQMMCCCISIWHVFVSMRTASVSELKEVIPLLMHVLDGATDVQSLVTQDTNWDRYVLGEDSINVLKTKAEICSLLETFVQQLQDEFTAIVNEKLARGRENADAIIAAAEAQVSELIACLNIPRLIHILLDLVLYESQDLMTAATSLLTTVCHWRKREHELVADMRMLPAGSERLFQQILDTCTAIKDSSVDDGRADHIDRFVSLFNGAVMQDESARSVLGKPSIKAVVLEALRAWNVHAAVLETMPEDPLEDVPRFQTCIDFFLIFCKTGKNADCIAEHWPTFFNAMQRGAAAMAARARQQMALEGGGGGGGAGGGAGGGGNNEPGRNSPHHPGTPTAPNAAMQAAMSDSFRPPPSSGGASPLTASLVAPNRNINTEIQAPVLHLLRYIWARGNRLTPVQHADIKFVVSLVDAVDSLEVLPTLSSLLSQGIPSHQLQRDVLNILIDFDILKPNWWVRLHGQMTSNITNVLELCAAGGNPYTNSIVTTRLPLVVVVRQLHATGMSKLSAKCTLVRFATVAHFSESTAARAAADTTDVILGEMWWRLLRDDFMVRLDELPAALDVNDSLKQYIVELSSLLTAFFENRFQLSEVLRFEAIVKELRHIAATVHHVCSSLPHLKHLTPSERFVLYKLGKAVLQSLRQLKDHSVSQLADSIANIDEKALLEAPVESLRKPAGAYANHSALMASVTPSGSPNTPSVPAGAAAAAAAAGRTSGDNSRSQSAAAAGAGGGGGGGGGAASGRHGAAVAAAASWQTDSLAAAEHAAAEQRQLVMQQRLNELCQSMSKRAEEDTTIDILVSLLASLDFHDQHCWKQRVIRRLLLAVQRQQFGPEAICVVLRAVRMCIESAAEGSPQQQRDMQNMMESLGALPVCTRLFDAVNTDIIIESLRLGIATLLDGNSRVQNHFLEYLLATEEKMFFAIKRCCERSSLELYYWRRSQKSATADVDLRDGDLVFAYLKLMLRFVQLLCEGHNLGLQEYVREQHDNIRSINTLHCVIGLMKTLLLGATQPVEDELIQCFELCTEVCQGPCANNQLALISSGCGTIINTALTDPTVSLDVKSSAVTTLLSLLEGCTDRQIGEVIERAVPISTLEDLYKLAITDEASDAVVYSVGIFLRILHDLFKGKRRAVKIHEILSSRPDIARKTGIIQIERSDEIERVYFRIPDACLNIREESKRRLLWDVDRSSQSAKLASFVELADDLILEMDLTEQHIVTFFEAARGRVPEPLLKYLPTTVNPAVEYWIFLSTSVAIVHNLFFLLDALNFRVVHLVLGLIQIFLSCCIIFIDWQVASNVYFHKYKKQKRQVRLEAHSGASSGVAPSALPSQSGTDAGGAGSDNNSGSGGGGNNNNNNNSGGAGGDDVGAGSGESGSLSIAGSGAGAHAATKASVHVSPVRELVLRLSRGRALQSISFLMFAVLGTVWTPYCLGVHLLWVIDLSPAFQNVVAAITLNAKTLSLTIVLGMLFIYFFSMVGYSMFPEDFDTDDDPLYRENCASLSNCFLFMLTTGLRQGGGVGDVMRPKSWKQPQFVARKIFDFSFFAFMIIVFLNILFGIIIDTFAELRDAKSRKEDDMRLRCFICGIDSHVFDRHGEGFLWHIKHEHSMWQYLYFLHHLRVKDPANYTGQESYISRLLDRKDFSFFPQRCMSLEGKYDRAAAENGGDGTVSSGAAAGGVGDGSGGTIIGGKASSASGALSAATQHAHALMMMQHHHQQGGQPFDQAAALQQHFDKLTQQLRRALISSGSGGGGGDRSRARSPGGPASGGGAFHRGALDVATQTSGGDTLIQLQFQLQQAQNEIRKLTADKQAMHQEMKSQVEELWKLKSQVQGQIDARNRIHALESELANKHRECDLAYTERDAVLRQNAFLQKEADRLLVAQTQQDVANRMRGPDRVHPSPLHALRDSMLQRSQLYDALQIPGDDQQQRAPPLGSSAIFASMSSSTASTAAGGRGSSGALPPLMSPINPPLSTSAAGGVGSNNENDNSTVNGVNKTPAVARLMEL